MKIYCARHGQPEASRYINNDNRFPAFDGLLTEIGVKQAQLLGKYLKKLGFIGIIYSSPFRRTMHTASIIAEELSLRFNILEGIREIHFGNPVHGLSADELKSEFPLCDIKNMSYPWWTDKKETMEDVCNRVSKAADEVLGDRTGQDVLFVGHGASVYALRTYLNINNLCEPCGGWNCALSMLDTETNENYSHDTSFLPYDMITDNANTLKKVIADNMKRPQ